MNEQSLGTISSVIVHSFILILLFSFSKTAKPFKKPVIVDFSLSHELFLSEKPKTGRRSAAIQPAPAKKTQSERTHQSVIKKVPPPRSKRITPVPEIPAQPVAKKVVAKIPAPDLTKKVISRTPEKLPVKVEQKEMTAPHETAPQIIEEPQPAKAVQSTEEPQPVVSAGKVTNTQTVAVGPAENGPPGSEAPLPGSDVLLDEPFYSSYAFQGLADSLPTDSDTEGNGEQQEESSSVGEATDAGTVKPDPEQYYLQQHFKTIHEIVRKRIQYPKVARRMGWTGKVLVSFLVDKNGDVSDIEIVKSSGYPLLDKSAVSAIRRIACFPKPPMTAKIIIPINFELKTVLTS
ncbi:energy transducer TonB [bacterium]|nr:energy transducer TonB [bacterium]